MKQMIDGKLYNTETAELILTLYSGARSSQRDYYMTKKGAFFVHYVRDGKLALVTEDTMKSLLATYDVDKYIEIWGDEDIEEG